MKLTKEHILELFRQLPTEVVCDYVNPGRYTVKKKPIDGNDVHFSLYENGQKKDNDVPLTEVAMETMANSITENVPISIDSALVNGGNKRSAIEGALIRTSEFYSIKDGRNKKIVWVPGKPHTVGEKGIWDENEELPPALNDGTSQMAMGSEELRDDYSLEDVGKRFAEMVKADNSKNIAAICIAFGLKYGRAIEKNGYKAKELVDAANRYGANIDHSQDEAVNNGRSLFEIINKGSVTNRVGKIYWDGRKLLTLSYEKRRHICYGTWPFLSVGS